MSFLKDEYYAAVAPRLKEAFGHKNIMSIPHIEKIVVNIGMGEMAQNKDIVESLRDELAAITGQRPVLRRSKKAISNFKLRAGAPVGYKVTLRKKRMYEFLERLINFSMPRIRDFRGVPRSGFDERGNYTLGIKEQTIFPEIDLDKAPLIHGMDITIVTTANNPEEGLKLLEAFGMPFTK